MTTRSRARMAHPQYALPWRGRLRIAAMYLRYGPTDHRVVAHLREPVLAQERYEAALIDRLDRIHPAGCHHRVHDAPEGEAAIE